MGMESNVDEAARQALIAAARRLTPEQRLKAFHFYNQLVMELYGGDQNLRSVRSRVRKKLDENI